MLASFEQARDKIEAQMASRGSSRIVSDATSSTSQTRSITNR